MCSVWLSDPTLSQGSCWPSGQIRKKAQLLTWIFDLLNFHVFEEDFNKQFFNNFLTLELKPIEFWRLCKLLWTKNYGIWFMKWNGWYHILKEKCLGNYIWIKGQCNAHFLTAITKCNTNKGRCLKNVLNKTCDNIIHFSEKNKNGKANNPAEQLNY